MFLLCWFRTAHNESWCTDICQAVAHTPVSSGFLTSKGFTGVVSCFESLLVPCSATFFCIIEEAVFVACLSLGWPANGAFVHWKLHALVPALIACASVCPAMNRILHILGLFPERFQDDQPAAQLHRPSFVYIFFQTSLRGILLFSRHPTQKMAEAAEASLTKSCSVLKVSCAKENARTCRE